MKLKPLGLHAAVWYFLIYVVCLRPSIVHEIRACFGLITVLSLHRAGDGSTAKRGSVRNAHRVFFCKRASSKPPSLSVEFAFNNAIEIN